MIGNGTIDFSSAQTACASHIMQNGATQPKPAGLDTATQTPAHPPKHSSFYKVLTSPKTIDCGNWHPAGNPHPE